MPRVDPTWPPPSAAHRHGVLTRRDALAEGLTEDQVRHRAESGAWRRVCGAGLALATTAPTAWQDAHAAALTWPDATLAGVSAALLHGMPVPSDDRVHAVVPSARADRGNAQRTWCADRLRRGALSVAEDRLHALLHRGGVTGWTANTSLLAALGVPAVVDVWFADVRLVVEVDGRSAHGHDRFQDDRTRQNLLVGAGCTVLRSTWHDLTARPTHVLTQIVVTRHRLHAAHGSEDPGTRTPENPALVVSAYRGRGL